MVPEVCVQVRWSPERKRWVVVLHDHSGREEVLRSEPRSRVKAACKSAAELARQFCMGWGVFDERGRFFDATLFGWQVAAQVASRSNTNVDTGRR
jgi:hypothetical protein